MSDESGTTTYNYDGLGRMVLETRTIDGRSHNTEYSYDLSDNLMSITYPSGLIMSYTRDELRRVTQMDLNDPATGFNQTLAQDIDYLPFGPIQQLTYGNGLQLNKNYGTDYLLASQTLVNTETQTELQNLSYSYNGHGEIDAITNLIDPAQSQTFGYDLLGRIEAESMGTDSSTDFSYDALGNRLGFTILTDTGTTTQTLTYENGSSKLATQDNLNIVHDAVGNKVQELDGSNELEGWAYNARNRMQNYSKNGNAVASYLYNGLGQRVQAFVRSKIRYSYLLCAVFLLSLMKPVYSQDFDHSVFKGKWVFKYPNSEYFFAMSVNCDYSGMLYRDLSGGSNLKKWSASDLKKHDDFIEIRVSEREKIVGSAWKLDSETASATVLLMMYQESGELFNSIPLYLDLISDKNDCIELKEKIGDEGWAC